jgi:hypothetical protein
METKLNILFENATWKVAHEFVSPEGVVSPDKGEFQFKVLPDKILMNRRFIDDYGDEIFVQHDIRKIDDLNYEYETNDIAANVGSIKGSMHVERNRLYTILHVGNTPINGFEVTVRDGDNSTIYGALYYSSTLIKTWNAVLVKITEE